MIPPSNHTNNEEPKGNLGRGVISLGQEKIDITKYSISEDESVREQNEEDDEDNKADTIDNSGGGIEELEDDKVVRPPTDNDDDHDNLNNIIEGDPIDNYIYQVSNPNDTSSPSEEERHKEILMTLI